jgi:hypothetical protein
MNPMNSWGGSGAASGMPPIGSYGLSAYTPPVLGNGMGMNSPNGVTIVNNYGYAFNMPGMGLNNQGSLCPVRGFDDPFSGLTWGGCGLPGTGGFGLPGMGGGFGGGNNNITQILVSIIGLLLQACMGNTNTTPPGTTPPTHVPGDINYSSGNTEQGARIAAANAWAANNFNTLDVNPKNGQVDEAELIARGMTAEKAKQIMDTQNADGALERNISVQENAAALFAMDVDGNGIVTVAEQNAVTLQMVQDKFNQFFKG